jgi:hypothetical protein
MPEEAWDPVRAAAGTVHRGVLEPALLACPDLPDAIRLIQDAYYFRLVDDHARFKLPENYQSGRAAAAEDRAKRQLRALYAPFERYAARRPKTGPSGSCGRYTRPSSATPRGGRWRWAGAGRRTTGSRPTSWTTCSACPGSTWACTSATGC